MNEITWVDLKTPQIFCTGLGIYELKSRVWHMGHLHTHH